MWEVKKAKTRIPKRAPVKTSPLPLKALESYAVGKEANQRHLSNYD